MFFFSKPSRLKTSLFSLTEEFKHLLSSYPLKYLSCPLYNVLIALTFVACFFIVTWMNWNSVGDHFYLPGFCSPIPIWCMLQYVLTPKAERVQIRSPTLYVIRFSLLKTLVSPIWCNAIHLETLSHPLPYFFTFIFVAGAIKIKYL